MFLLILDKAWYSVHETNDTTTTDTIDKTKHQALVNFQCVCVCV